VGETLVEYEFTDACGNTATCSFTVTVNPVNVVDVALELEGDLNPSGDALTRCITIKFYDCQGATEPAEERVEVNFAYRTAPTVPTSPAIISSFRAT
jgi:hypothetical protein